MSLFGNFWKRPFSKYLLYFGAYQLLNIIFYIILVSIATFFHFLLDHSLADIEDWIFNRGWEILIIARCASVYLVFKYLSVRIEERDPFKRVLGQGRFNFNTDILIGIIFLLISVLALGQPKLELLGLWSWGRLLTSFFGALTLLMSDLLILLTLNFIYPIDKVNKLVMPFFASLLSSFVMSFLFNLELQYGLFVFGALFISNFLRTKNSGPHYGHSGLFAVIFFAPMISLLGMDPLWKKSYALLAMSNNIGIEEMSVLLFVVIMYWQMKKGTQKLRPS